MRIFITGGAGFLGSHLIDHLIGKGHEVVCLDNLITGSRSNVTHLSSERRFTLIEQDVTKPLDLSGRIDYVLHFASPASPVDYLKFPIQTLKVGSLGTHNALGLAKAKGAKFLLASTSEVYGDPLVSPQTEEYWGNVNPVGPRGVYDEAKRFAEALTLAYHRTHKMDTKIARIFNTYGPRMRKADGRAIPNFINQALKGDPLTVYGDGSQTRSFCFISDLIGGLARLMESALNEPVNLGNPEEMTLMELAKKIIQLTGSKSKIELKPLPIDDPKQRRPDISKAKKLLQWKPMVPLEGGLRLTLEDFRKRAGAEKT